jgi:hypothetical protein
MAAGFEAGSKLGAPKAWQVAPALGPWRKSHRVALGRTLSAPRSRALRPVGVMSPAGCFSKCQPLDRFQRSSGENHWAPGSRSSHLHGVIMALPPPGASAGRLLYAQVPGSICQEQPGPGRRAVGDTESCSILFSKPRMRL